MNLYQLFFKQYNTFLQELFPLFHTEYHKFDYNFDPARDDFGDLSISDALLIAKVYKTNPYDIAKTIQESLYQIDFIDKIEVIKPGFINIFFKNSLYASYLKNIYESKIYYNNNTSDNNIYNIEFVSANPTGPLHIGHGRGAIIGDILYQVMKLKHYQVTAEYYINDAGNQINRLGQSLFLRYQEKCFHTNIQLDNELYQGEYLIDLASQIYNQYQETKLLSSIEWFSEYAKDHLLKDIKDTLSEYRINFDVWFSEKNLHNNEIDKAISLLNDKGYIYITKEDNTVWFRATHFGDEKDRVLKKQDGQWTYTAADIAYLLNKKQRGFTKIIMILGQDHHSFKIRMHAIAEAIGFPKENLVILLYQLVTLKNENKIVRMSKRKGNSIELQDIIDNVGSDVARFFYLHRKREAHLEFDIAQALEKDKNNPVFYIQYALVRIRSVLTKYQNIATDTQILDSITIYNYQNDERLLLKKIDSLNSMLNDIIQNYHTHQLAFYTLELSSLFHSFYRHNNIMSDNPIKTQTRIALITTIRDVLTICANTLGISIPDRM